MLQLILGRAGSGKTWELYSRMEQTLREGGRAILLVPEQFSFENERELYLRFGPQLSSQVEVLGFNRLCDNIFRFYGGLAGRTLDDTGRRILMGIALQEVGSALEVYAAQADKPGFIEDMIQEIGELKAAGITPEALAEADFSDTPSLRGKVADIGTIYAAYQALIEESYIDGEDNILRALDLLDPREFFGGVSVFVDSFTAFMAAEYRMLAAILAGAQEVCAAFTCDGLEEREDGLGVFSASRESAARLMRMAQESGGTVAEPLLLGEPRRFLNCAGWNKAFYSRTPGRRFRRLGRRCAWYRGQMCMTNAFIWRLPLPKMCAPGGCVTMRLPLSAGICPPIALRWCGCSKNLASPSLPTCPSRRPIPRPSRQ